MTEYKGTGTDSSRIARLAKAREDQQKRFEESKKAIEEKHKIESIRSKFASNRDDVEDQLKQATVGLVSYEDFKRKRQDLEQAAAALLEEKKDKSSVRTIKKPRVAKAKLSFALDEEDEDGGEESAENGQKDKKKPGKNPFVDTTFLPDREREEEERKIREQLSVEWEKEQEKVKNQMISVTYSYYDGTGHRRTVAVRKGTKIDQFLELVRQEFHELRGISSENMLFIKEDVIIPHDYTFYDLIVTKAKGKSGPLWNWDVHDDIRMLADATKEKDESHAAKVVERRWYERNKHIFPASRWEVYDPNVKRDRYTIHGDEVTNK
ncbi:uncharacterized protein ACA1_055310 [Acanthamoeba castellanii str. Neff]|uniref:FAM50A/XAP5 C-terminal domain-containing protein n=1 Tax=Acanthamoeba castellanii (strain ATCC 30010 / Neff) TaxID=1257118 RepID=L8H6I7_ACACF|nr:uncharacterized protein ACA1_055310 [Acanthamoeba castellanii str. Neff]ELR20765.1 hypothetical protein ACA1_055310 [Acanthamoeba castellanii str. Neff]